LLDGEAHDAYILPYFKRGAFLELYLTDYVGPRYKMTNDEPRGVKHYIKDVVGFPKKVQGFPPVVFTRAESKDNIIKSPKIEAEVDRKTGHLTRINGESLSLVKISFRGAYLKDVQIINKKDKLIVTGWFPEFGKITLNYALSKEKIFCVIQADIIDDWKPDCKTEYWDDCVYLIHQRPSNSIVLRHCSGVVEETSLPEFFSGGFVYIKSEGIELKLSHGGNIFFRQTSKTLQNRLWSYNEWSESFWWGVELKKMKPQ